MTPERETLFEQLLIALNNEDRILTWTAEQKRRAIQKELNEVNQITTQVV